MRGSRPASRGCPFGAVLALVVFALSSPIACGAEGDDLAPELEVLRPLIGSWTGRYDVPGESPEILRSWTPILDGQAIRETRTVADADFSAETIYFFDREAQVISYVGITNNGYVSRGEMIFDAGEFTQTGQQIRPDGTSCSIRVVFTCEEDGTLVNKLWNLEGDVWVAGHIIIYTLSESDD